MGAGTSKKVIASTQQGLITEGGDRFQGTLVKGVPEGQGILTKSDG
jgi:hypothetical protein